MPLVIKLIQTCIIHSKKTKTVDLVSNSECEIVVPGRHDPCVVPRATTLVESLVSLILADHAIKWNLIPPVLSEVKK